MNRYLVQPAYGQTQASASACTAAFGSNVTAGNAIIVAVESYDASNTVTLTDNLGNTYVQIGSYLNQFGAGTRLSLWYAKNITGGACTVSATPASSGFLLVVAAEYSGIGTGTPLDGNSSNVGTATSATTGTIAVSGSNELVIAAFCDFQAPASTGAVWLPTSPLVTDFVSAYLNTGTGGNITLASAVVSAGLNATLVMKPAAFFGAIGASFTGSFSTGGGGGGGLIVSGGMSGGMQ